MCLDGQPWIHSDEGVTDEVEQLWDDPTLCDIVLVSGGIIVNFLQHWTNVER